MALGPPVQLLAKLFLQCQPRPALPTVTAVLIEAPFMQHKQLRVVALIWLPVIHSVIKPAFFCCYYKAEKKITVFLIHTWNEHV